MFKRFSSFLILALCMVVLACQYTPPPGAEWQPPRGPRTYEPPECGGCVLMIEMSSYIVGINWFTNRFYEDSLEEYDDINGNKVKLPVETTYAKNELPSGLPLTIWFSVHTLDEYEDQNIPDDIEIEKYMTKKIVKTKMYYKILQSGKSYNDPSCKWRLGNDISYPQVSPLGYSKISRIGNMVFGSNTISKEEIIANGDTISAGDRICIIWYFMDEDSNENTDEIEIGKAEPYINIIDGSQVSELFNIGDTTILVAHCIMVVYDGSTIYGR